MHQNQNFSGLRLEPRWGAYSAPPDPLAGFRGGEGRGWKGKGEGKEKEREGRGEGGKGKEKGGRGGIIPPPTIPGSAPGSKLRPSPPCD